MKNFSLKFIISICFGILIVVAPTLQRPGLLFPGYLVYGWCGSVFGASIFLLCAEGRIRFFRNSLSFTILFLTGLAYLAHYRVRIYNDELSELSKYRDVWPVLVAGLTGPILFTLFSLLIVFGLLLKRYFLLNRISFFLSTLSICAMFSLSIFALFIYNIEILSFS